MYTVKTCHKRPLKKKTKTGFHYPLSFNAGHKYSAILSTIKLPFYIKIFVLSIFEWWLKTGFTVLSYHQQIIKSNMVIPLVKSLQC